MIVLVAAALAMMAAPVAFGQEDTALIGALYPEDWEYERLATGLAVSDFNEYLAGSGWSMDAVVDSGLDGMRDARIVVGDVATATHLEYAETSGVVLLSCCPGAVETAVAGDGLFVLAPNALSQGAALGRLFEANSLRVVIPVWSADTHGDQVRNSAAVDFVSRGGLLGIGLRYDAGSDTREDVSELAAEVEVIVERYGADRVGILLIPHDDGQDIVEAAMRHDILREVRWFGSARVAESPYLAGEATVFADAARFTAIRSMASPGTLAEYVLESIGYEGGDRESAIYAAYDAVWLAGLALMEQDAGLADALVRAAAAHDGALYSDRLDGYGDLEVANYQVLEVVNGSWTKTSKYVSQKDILASASQPAGDVHVGALYPLTGRLSSKGTENLAGTDLAAADFNKLLRSIDAGWQMVLAPEDSETDPNAALEKAQTLFSRGVDIIIGPQSSANNRQIKPYADINSMMVISCCSSAPALAIPGDSLFRLVPDDTKQSTALGRILVHDGIMAVVPIWRGDAYGDGLVEETTRDYTARGGIMGEGIRYNPDLVEFSGEVSLIEDEVGRLVEAHGAGNVAVLLVAFDEATQIMQSASNYDALGQVKWYGSRSIAKITPIIEDPISKEFAISVGFTTTHIMESHSEVFEYVRSHIIDKYGREPTTFVYQAYDAAWLVGLSMLQTGATDASSIKAVFHEVAANHDGALGDIILNEAGDVDTADQTLWIVTPDGWAEAGHYISATDSMTE